MHAQNDNSLKSSLTDLALPTYRFGRLESPLTTLARNAGFGSWPDLVAHIVGGATVTAQAPEICGRSIGNALLIRDGCEQYGISVVDVIFTGQQEMLVLATSLSAEEDGRLKAQAS